MAKAKTFKCSVCGEDHQKLTEEEVKLFASRECRTCGNDLMENTELAVECVCKRQPTMRRLDSSETYWFECACGLAGPGRESGVLASRAWNAGDGDRYSGKDVPRWVGEPSLMLPFTVPQHEQPTLRDRMAMAAMTGILANKLCTGKASYARIARNAYIQADAMLAEREIVRDKHGGIPCGKQPPPPVPPGPDETTGKERGMG